MVHKGAEFFFYLSLRLIIRVKTFFNYTEGGGYNEGRGEAGRGGAGRGGAKEGRKEGKERRDGTGRDRNGREREGEEGMDSSAEALVVCEKTQGCCGKNPLMNIKSKKLLKENKIIVKDVCG